MVRCQGSTCAPLSDTGTTARLRAVWGPGSDDIWIAGDPGVLLHFDGRSWELVPGATTNFLYAGVTFGRDTFVVGDGGTILHHRRP